MFAIGPASTSRFRFGAFLSNESKYFSFAQKREKERDREDASETHRRKAARAVIIDARLTDDKRLTFIETSMTGLRPLIGYVSRVTIYLPPLLFSFFPRRLQQGLHRADVKRRFLWAGAVSRAFYVRVIHHVGS